MTDLLNNQHNYICLQKISEESVKIMSVVISPDLEAEQLAVFDPTYQCWTCTACI